MALNCESIARKSAYSATLVLNPDHDEPVPTNAKGNKSRLLSVVQLQVYKRQIKQRIIVRSPNKRRAYCVLKILARNAPCIKQ